MTTTTTASRYRHPLHFPSTTLFSAATIPHTHRITHPFLDTLHTTQSSQHPSPLSFGPRSCCNKKELAYIGAQHHKKFFFFSGLEGLAGFYTCFDIWVLDTGQGVLGRVHNFLVSGREIPCIKQRYTSRAGLVLLSYGFSAYGRVLDGNHMDTGVGQRQAQIVGPGIWLRDSWNWRWTQHPKGAVGAWHPFWIGLGIDDLVMIGIFLDDGSCTGSGDSGVPVVLGFAPHTRRATLSRLAIIKLKHFPIHQLHHRHRQCAMFPFQGLHSIPGAVAMPWLKYSTSSQSPLSELSPCTCPPAIAVVPERQRERSCSPVPHAVDWTSTASHVLGRV